MIKRTKKLTRKPVCLNPICKRPSRSRGLCYACYQTAFRLVKDTANRVTWEKLEKSGRALPPSRVRRSKEYRDWFSVIKD